MMRAIVIALALLSFAAGYALAAPEVKNSGVSTLTFQDGRQPASDSEFFRDTYIASAAADSGLNHGAADSMRVSGSAWAGPFKAGQNKILIDFDFAAALPDSAEIRRCRLCLYQLIGATGSVTDTVNIQRVINVWNEGTGDNNGTAQAANADWNNRTGLAWAVAGASGAFTNANFARAWSTATDSSSANPAFTGADSLSSYTDFTVYDYVSVGEWFFPKTGAGAGSQQGWQCFDVTRDARNVHSGAYGPVFNGWILSTHNNANNKRFAFASSEHDYKVIRPYMVIDFVDLTAGVGGGGVKVQVGPGH